MGLDTMRECDIFDRKNGFDEACRRAHARVRMWRPKSEHATARRFALDRVESRLGCSEAGRESISVDSRLGCSEEGRESISVDSRCPTVTDVSHRNREVSQ